MFGGAGGQGCAENGIVKMLVQRGKMLLSAKRGEVQDDGKMLVVRSAMLAASCGLDNNRWPKKVCFFCAGQGLKQRGFTCIFAVFSCLHMKSTCSYEKALKC